MFLTRLETTPYFLIHPFLRDPRAAGSSYLRHSERAMVRSTGLCVAAQASIDDKETSPAFRHLVYLLNVEPSFQNWDMRIRPLGGNFMENQMFRTKIINSSVQRSKIKKIDPRKIECACVYIYIYIYTIYTYNLLVPAIFSFYKHSMQTCSNAFWPRFASLDLRIRLCG